MKGQIYRDVILEQHTHLFQSAMGAEFVFTDENVCPHRANFANECLQSAIGGFTRMDWPVLSPNLNPVENVWDILVRRVVVRQQEISESIA
ncbi:DDE_3 domain-containing protein [Trichonephila clavipes]|nr:DDE_3 domain-containing protein [Trichonephila clavipes]